MSYKLEKPYTQEQKNDFIVNYNYNQCLLIEETDKALFALEANEIMQDGEPIIDPDYESKQAQKQEELRIEEIKSRLTELDKKRIRAICENEIKDEETGETWLEYYNEQVKKLRNRL